MKNASLALIAIVSILAACAAAPRLPAGLAEPEVRAALGEPALVLPGPDGGKSLAYPRGPGGLETHMARLGADGRLVAVEQVLDEAHFAKIRRGETTQEELLRLIGPPWRRTDFDNLGQVAWDYRFRDLWGYIAEFSAMVDRRGIVASTVTRRLEPRSDRY